MIAPKILRASLFITAFFSSSVITATEYEVTGFFGQMYSSDLTHEDNDISLDSGTNFGLAFAWLDSANGQGQIMLNAVSHDFDNGVDDNKHSLDILYAHFNGVALFRQHNYITTVSLGLGGAYFDSSASSELYPSATVAIGTRYEFSNNLALITELRGYASLVDDEDNMFCKGDNCHAQFDDALWMETNISVGIAYKF